MAKKSKAVVLKKKKSSGGIMKFLETIVILGTVAAVVIRFLKGNKK